MLDHLVCLEVSWFCTSKPCFWEVPKSGMSWECVINENSMRGSGKGKRDGRASMCLSLSSVIFLGFSVLTYKAGRGIPLLYAYWEPEGIMSIGGKRIRDQNRGAFSFNPCWLYKISLNINLEYCYYFPHF